MKTNSSIEKLNSNIEQLLNQGAKPLSFKEACTYLNVTSSHLYKLTYQNLIPHYKPNGKKIYFKKSDLDQYIFRNRKSNHSDPVHQSQGI